MPTLQAGEILDLVALTQNELGRDRWTELATDTQHHIAFSNLMRDNRVQFQSGTEIQFNVQTRHSGAARNVGLFEVDDVNVKDVMTTATVPWRHYNTSYAIDMREIDINRDPARIVELIRVRRADSMISLAELMEQDFWGKPVDSTDDSKPFGSEYWIVGSATQGFNGQLPAGFTDVAGLAPATVTRWRNYTDQFTDVTEEDFVRRARRAITFTNFISPTPIPSYNTGDRFGFYTNYFVLSRLEEIAVRQNDQLGRDVASMDGRVMVRGNPVFWAPFLENKTGNPFYGINWGVFAATFLTGWFMRDAGVRVAANQHTVLHAHNDTTVNFVCRDRRRTFVLRTGAIA